MQIHSTTKYVRISAFKAREVAREIQGLPVAQALDLVAFSPKKAAVLIGKTLKSAIANAENNNNLRAEDLFVKEARIGEGPTAKRFQPKARGSAGPILKRSSHIRIVVSDEGAAPKLSPKAAKKAAQAAKPARRKSAKTAKAAPAAATTQE
jgi:large subunit ribosomal protein L22